jgi:triacylglycerol esterase/lipase EstA (alpha/beta hydrolase family)
MPLPTVIIPGYFAGASPYQELEHLLLQQGHPTVTVPLRRQDWIPTLGGRSVAPILQRIDQTVQQVLQNYQASRINLVGHSAGGWIARIYIGGHPYWGQDNQLLPPWNSNTAIASLLTLGTPHTSQERWTRRNLEFVNRTYPGAFYSAIRYVCLAGKAIYGQRRWGTWFAYSSYQLTSGQGNCWGDGITPIAAAHLEGAKNLILDGVGHSPRSGSLWYGSPEIVPQWSLHLS